MKGLMVLTPDDEDMVAALTSFRLDGLTSTSANDSVVRQLAEKFGVLTVRRTGPAAGDCIRVTPSVYTSADDVMKLVNALRSITASPKTMKPVMRRSDPQIIRRLQQTRRAASLWSAATCPPLFKALTSQRTNTKGHDPITV
jgi:hypothetical protein